MAVFHASGWEIDEARPTLDTTLAQAGFRHVKVSDGLGTTYSWDLTPASSVLPPWASAEAEARALGLDTELRAALRTAERTAAGPAGAAQ